MMRPTQDDALLAIEEAKSLIDCVCGYGHEPSTSYLKDVLQWALLGTQLPIEFLEQRLQMELYGKKDKDVGHVCMTLKREARVRVGEDVEIYIKQIMGHGAGNAVKIVVTAPIVKKVYRIKQDVSKS